MQSLNQANYTRVHPNIWSQSLIPLMNGKNLSWYWKLILDISTDNLVCLGSTFCLAFVNVIPPRKMCLFVVDLNFTPCCQSSTEECDHSCQEWLLRSWGNSVLENFHILSQFTIAMQQPSGVPIILQIAIALCPVSSYFSNTSFIIFPKKKLKIGQ